MRVARPSRTLGRSLVALGAGALLAAAAAGCGRGGTDPETDSDAVSVSVVLPMTVLHVGDTLRANVAAFDSTGHVLVGRTARWETSDARVASVSPSGLIVAIGAGRASISATIGRTRGTVDVQVLRPPAFSVAVTPESVAVAATVVVDFTAVARDVAGQPIDDVHPTWSSSSPDVATVDSLGHVTTVAPGRADIAAAVDGVSGRGIVVVTRPSSVHVTGVAPALLAPGATITLTGSGFSPNRASDVVTVGGAAAAVRSASATQIVATVATTGYACAPTRDVPVTVTVAGESGTLPATLQVAQPRTLAVGQAVVLSDPAQSQCNELAPAAGRYVLAVFNTSATSTPIAFSLHGAPSTTLDIPAASAIAASMPSLPRTTSGAAVAPAAAPLVDGGSAALSATLAPPRRAVVRHLAARLPAARLQAEGDTVTLHVLTPSARSCSDAADDVHARTVLVGRHVAVFEDVTAPLAGTMDNDYQRIAQEFDDVTYPLIEATFGNPLAVDARLGHTGRVALLFTHAVNDRPGALGMSFSCDLLPASVARASNEQQIVYLAVPTSAAVGLGDGRATGTRDAWRRRIRAVIAHETKHVTSYAERLARAEPLEDLWAEEGSALVAEELFARTVRALPTRANTRYAQSLVCELRPSDAGCGDAPVAFTDHFARLYATLADPAALSPVVTDPADDPGAAFYGGAWWLLRWAADQYAPSDAAFFRALIAGPQTGVDNLVARTGRAWGDLLGEWWLATAVDDLPGLAPQRPTLAEPSWQLRDVFAGAHASGDPRFPSAFPLRPTALTFGDFVAEVPGGVRGGGAAFFQLDGPAAPRQLLELRPLPPATLVSPSLGVAIVRVP